MKKIKNSFILVILLGVYVTLLGTEDEDKNYVKPILPAALLVNLTYQSFLPLGGLKFVLGLNRDTIFSDGANAVAASYICAANPVPLPGSTLIENLYTSIDNQEKSNFVANGRTLQTGLKNILIKERLILMGMWSLYFANISRQITPQRSVKAHLLTGLAAGVLVEGVRSVVKPYQQTLETSIEPYLKSVIEPYCGDQSEEIKKFPLVQTVATNGIPMLIQLSAQQN